MRISTRLKLHALTSVLALMVLIPVLFWALHLYHQAMDDNALADEILTELFEYSALRDEYLLFAEDRPRIQWGEKEASLTRLLTLADQQFKGNIPKTILADMRQKFEIASRLFTRLIQVKEVNKNHSDVSPLEQRLLRQQILNASTLYLDATHLQAFTTQKVDQTHQQAFFLTVIIVLVMTLIATINLLTINRSLNAQLEKISHGAEIIAKGNLEHRIVLPGDDELTDLAATLNSMTEKVQLNTLQLKAAHSELEAFSYSVSHDLRAPLRHINGFVELLYKKDLGSFDEKSRHYLQVIADSSRKMGELIDDLLSFSRMGRIEMLRTRVNLTALVSEAQHVLKSHSEGQDIIWDIAPLPSVYGDPVMLRLVLVNLFSNAIKFSHGRAPIRIAISWSQSDNPDETIIAVKDNGAGFDMRYVDKLFGLFQRLHNSEEFEGTGLGLANVQRIIHRHRGRVWAEGVVGNGAAFYFSLPTSKGGMNHGAKNKKNPPGRR